MRMEGWFYKDLGDAMLAGEALDQIDRLFQSSGSSVRRPGTLAVFVRHCSEGRLHCRVEVFFPPPAAALAEAVGARPCARPSADNLSLLVGPEGAWSQFFPERRPR